jgi:hypothetical protein
MGLVFIPISMYSISTGVPYPAAFFESAGPEGNRIQPKEEILIMNLSEPKVVTFWIAVILGVLGIIFFFVPSLTAYAFWAVLVGLVVLVLGNLLKGL